MLSLAGVYAIEFHYNFGRRMLSHASATDQPYLPYNLTLIYAGEIPASHAPCLLKEASILTKFDRSRRHY